MKFLLGTSYCVNGSDKHYYFAVNWTRNQFRDDLKPAKTVVISDQRGITWPADAELLVLPGNLGHVGHLISGEKKHDFCGWSASVITLAMMAYMSELDFVYQEPDCLLFGPCIQQAYRDLSDGLMVFGAKHQSAPWQACSQSFFVIRHQFIPAFVGFYLSLGPDPIVGNLPECKFQKLEDQYGKDAIKRLSFGVDRERPIPWDAPCWYGQHFTAEEMQQIRERNLL